jgi:FAD/FMN-containing dehydrogenase
MSAAPPLSAHELCESVRHARAFDPGRLDRVLRIDTRRALVEVQANAPWKALAEQLRPGDAQARQVRTTRATVGESLAWNAAGPDGRPAVTHVESMTLVTAEGQLRRVDRLANPALFAFCVGGHGLFGVLYSVTLRIESLARAVAEAMPVQTLQAAKAACPSRSLQVLVPPQQVDGFLDDSRARCSEWRIAPEGVSLRHTRHEDETFLRWACRDYMEVSFAFAERSTIGGAVRSAQLRRELIDAAIARGGSFPIACTPEATRAQTERCYPQLAAFLAEQRRIDPGERMANGWLRHQKALLRREACEVRWAR